MHPVVWGLFCVMNAITIAIFEVCIKKLLSFFVQKNIFFFKISLKTYKTQNIMYNLFNKNEFFIEKHRNIKYLKIITNFII